MSSNLSLLSKQNSPALFGADATTGIVACWVSPEGVACIWRRQNDKVVFESEPMKFFLWLQDDTLLTGYTGGYQVQKLAGYGAYQYLVEVERYEELLALSRYLVGVSGVPLSDRQSPVLIGTEAETQYLMRTGKTMWQGLTYNSVARLQLAVVAAGDSQRLSECFSQPLESVAVRFKQQTRVFGAQECGSEAAVFQQLTAFIRDCDPDIIEGHELFNNILPYLQARAAANEESLEWGRAVPGCSTLPQYRQSRLQIAEKTFEYKRWDIMGRQLADTWVLALLHDVSSRQLESFDLAAVAEQYGAIEEDSVAANQQIPVDRQAELVERLAGLLGYSFFLQSQIFPYSYQNTYLRGSATRINSLFLREYLRMGQAVAARREVEQFAGGYTSQGHVGLAHNVWHCDVQSLYPSVMLAWRIAPQNDSLGVFLELLEQLRTFRLQAKAKQRQAEEVVQALMAQVSSVPGEAGSEPSAVSGELAKAQDDSQFYHALQTTFKVLINAFYGYLGYSQGNFADYSAARQVTQKGREILLDMIGWLEQRGCKIIEVDTDGIYFVPPSALAAGSVAAVEPSQGSGLDDGGEQLIAQLNSHLPEGINVELDGRFAAMYSHKMKNYALLDFQGQMTVRGSALRSRSVEPFLRKTLSQTLFLALSGKLSEIPALFDQVASCIKQHRYGIELLAKTDYLKESLDSYSRKIAAKSRNRAACYELALTASRRYIAGDAVTYYITGNSAVVKAYENCALVANYDPEHPNENVKYYLSKLRELYKKIAVPLNLPAWKAK